MCPFLHPSAHHLQFNIENIKSLSNPFEKEIFQNQFVHLVLELSKMFQKVSKLEQLRFNFL